MVLDSSSQWTLSSRVNINIVPEHFTLSPFISYTSVADRDEKNISGSTGNVTTFKYLERESYRFGAQGIFEF